MSARTPPEDALADAVRLALLAWYAEHRRDLPWRADRDPYAVWVSEVMLQQTQVAAVVPYYARWMDRFPGVETLAAASLDEVLALWQGLGYYARARALHRAARQVADELGGQLPATRDGLLRLHGVGPYTAGAVASIAFGEAVAAVDGNVSRVLARLLAVEDEVTGGPARRRFEAFAGRLLAGLSADEHPGDLNQALMELGATVCVPLSPRCAACPVASVCAARALGRERELPRRAPRRARRRESVYAFVLSRQGTDGLLLARRPDHGLLGGLWEYPMLPADEADPAAVWRGATGLAMRDVRPGAAVEHVFTHIHLVATTVTGSLAADAAIELGDRYAEWRWVAGDQIDELPASALMGKLRAAVAAGGGET